MSDKREEILNYEHLEFVKDKGVASIYPKEFPSAYRDAAINAMDSYMKECCLELLEYMAKNEYRCYWMEDDNGDPYYFFSKGPGHENLSKEELFENFL